MDSIAGWTDQLLVGNDMIDADHRHLFALANAVHAGMQRPGHEDNVRAVLDDLMTYAREHFAREEALMTETRCPGHTEHVVEHRLLRYHLRNLHNRYVAGDRGLSEDLQIFIDRWLARHIMTADLRLAQHVQALSTQDADGGPQSFAVHQREQFAPARSWWARLTGRTPA